MLTYNRPTCVSVYLKPSFSCLFASRCPICARTFCLLWTSPSRFLKTRPWGRTISYAIIIETATPTGRHYNCISVRILVLLELWLQPFYCPVQCHILFRCCWYILEYACKSILKFQCKYPAEILEKNVIGTIMYINIFFVF